MKSLSFSSKLLNVDIQAVLGAGACTSSLCLEEGGGGPGVYVLCLRALHVYECSRVWAMKSLNVFVQAAP